MSRRAWFADFESDTPHQGWKPQTHGSEEPKSVSIEDTPIPVIPGLTPRDAFYVSPRGFLESELNTKVYTSDEVEEYYHYLFQLMVARENKRAMRQRI